MGQARQRRAEIDQLKAQGPRRKSVDTTGFLPDAGLATKRDQDCFLWFQMSELIQKLHNITGMRGYMQAGRHYLEMNVRVDIMDQSGEQHLAPQQQEGYMATLALTADNYRELASEVRKGAMSVRIRGRRTGRTEIAANSHERFEPILFKSAWSAGNDRGHMMYMVATGQGFIRTDSQKMAEFFDAVAEDMDARSRG